VLTTIDAFAQIHVETPPNERWDRQNWYNLARKKCVGSDKKTSNNASCGDGWCC